MHAHHQRKILIYLSFLIFCRLRSATNGGGAANLAKFIVHLNKACCLTVARAEAGSVDSDLQPLIRLILRRPIISTMRVMITPPAGSATVNAGPPMPTVKPN